jgi:hypothetical protein
MLDTIEAELNLPLSTNDVIVQQNGELRNEEIGIFDVSFVVL